MGRPVLSDGCDAVSAVLDTAADVDAACDRLDAVVEPLDAFAASVLADRNGRMTTHERDRLDALRGVLATLAEGATHAARLLALVLETPAERLTPPACGNDACPGWVWSEGARGWNIERCDDCARFPDDTAARLVWRAQGCPPRP